VVKFASAAITEDALGEFILKIFLLLLLCHFGSGVGVGVTWGTPQIPVIVFAARLDPVVATCGVAFDRRHCPGFYSLGSIFWMIPDCSCETYGLWLDTTNGHCGCMWSHLSVIR
jgi:hypothetical protein